MDPVKLVKLNHKHFQWKFQEKLKQLFLHLWHAACFLRTSKWCIIWIKYLSGWKWCSLFIGTFQNTLEEYFIVKFPDWELYILDPSSICNDKIYFRQAFK